MGNPTNLQNRMDIESGELQDTKEYKYIDLIHQQE